MNKTVLILIRFLLLFLPLLTVSAKESVKKKDSFIEDIFEIKIPGFEGAYNASMVEYDNGYLMAFRYDTYTLPINRHLEDFRQHIGVIRLDKNFQPQGPVHMILGDRTYDPRLLKIDDTIYIIFSSSGQTDPHSLISSHLNLCTIDYSEVGVTVSNRISLNVSFQQNWEKNWVPFNYKNMIYLEYTINPQVVIIPYLMDGSCKASSRNSQNIHWPYGIIRGGTPALPIEEDYLGFFHSSKIDSKTNKYTYYVGAYIFSNDPPFNLKKVSSEPFSHPNFYSTKHSPSTTSRVIFPGGFVIRDDKIYLCYGENDAAIKVMVLDKSELYRSMKNVE